MKRRQSSLAAPWLIAIAWGLCSPSPTFGQSVLLKDIRTVPDPGGSEPLPLLTIGTFTYFTQERLPEGREMWRTDGTPAGTILLKDIAPGGAGSMDRATVGSYGALGSTFLFVATHPTAGKGLWKSDGTPAGTEFVKIISPSASHVVSIMGVASGVAYVYESDSTAQTASLWRSDGTTAGTTVVKAWSGIAPYGLLSGSGALRVVTSGAGIYFILGDWFTGTQLWISNGSEAGTFRLADLCPAACSAYPVSNPIFSVNPTGGVFFNGYDSASGWELWSSNGTVAGTSMVADICPGACDSAPNTLVHLGGLLLFYAKNSSGDQELWRSDGTAGNTFKLLAPANSPGTPPRVNLGAFQYFPRGNQLFRTDGTVGGTTLVKDVRPGSNVWGIQELVVAGSQVFFTADDGAHYMQLWKSDGTAGGTALVKIIQLGSGGPRGLIASGSSVFFGGNDGSSGYELWKSDGTEAGTVRAKDICPGSCGALPLEIFSQFTAATRPDGRLVFAANVNGRGTTPWISDGTEAGTLQLSNLIGSSLPQQAVDLSGKTVFVASDDTHGKELWVSDGTSAGTQLLKDTCPGACDGFEDVQTSNQKTLYWYVNPGPSQVGNKAFFAAARQLWLTDGTPEGTRVVSGCSGFCFLRDFTDAGGLLFFATDGELWRSDGTAAGTTFLVSLNNFSTFLYGGGGSVMSRAVIGNTLFFFNDPSNGAPTGTGTELWRSDGTVTGTAVVKDIVPGPEGSYLADLTASRGRVYFFSSSAPSIGGLWVSDGTEAGTTRIKNVYGQGLTDVEGTLFFAGRDSFLGRAALWKSDGTESGTVLVRAIRSDTQGILPTNLRAVNGLLYFTADDGVNGLELWRSDGTAAGTFMVKDLAPGIASASPLNLRAWGDSLLFGATHPSTGQELWMSDGTGAGTVLVQDTSVGAFGRVTLIAPATTRAFFSAWDDTVGQELWSLTPPLSATIADTSVTEGDSGSRQALFRVTLTASPSSPVTLSYATADGAATAGSDYTPTSGVLTFGIGETEKTVGVNVLGDLTAESTETFFVNLSGASGAALLDSHAVGSVADDDDPPGRVSVRDATVTEGAAGVVTATFRVSLTATNKQTVSVGYTTVDGTAKDGEDYSRASGTLIFAPGEVTKDIMVSVQGDTKPESNESFSLQLNTVSNATLLQGTAFGVILDDDTQGAAARVLPSWQPFFAVDALETPFVGDFNGDGKTDLITFTRQNPLAVGDVYVALSTGAAIGPSSKWNDWFAITTDETVVLGDFDGDGKDDIGTWLGKSTRQIYVTRSLGDGMESAQVWLESVGRASSDVILAGDANGDGKDDIIDFARTEGKVFVALSTGAGFSAPTQWHPFFAVSTYERPAVGDVDGDGKADILTFTTDNPSAIGDVYVSTSTGAGFNYPSTKWHDWFAVSPSERIRIGDRNGDGRDDIFTFLPLPWGEAYSALSRLNSIGVNERWPQILLASDRDIPFVGDVNGDHKADVIVFAQGEGRVYVSLGK